MDNAAPKLITINVWFHLLKHSYIYIAHCDILIHIPLTNPNITAFEISITSEFAFDFFII